jgi:hypothetical protein
MTCSFSLVNKKPSSLILQRKLALLLRPHAQPFFGIFLELCAVMLIMRQFLPKNNGQKRFPKCNLLYRKYQRTKKTELCPPVKRL